jgi:TATA-binding protein-associated factor Taf7
MCTSVRVTKESGSSKDAKAGTSAAPLGGDGSRAVDDNEDEEGMEEDSETEEEARRRNREKSKVSDNLYVYAYNVCVLSNRSNIDKKKNPRLPAFLIVDLLISFYIDC